MFFILFFFNFFIYSLHFCLSISSTANVFLTYIKMCYWKYHEYLFKFMILTMNKNNIICFWINTILIEDHRYILSWYSQRRFSTLTSSFRLLPYLVWSNYPRRRHVALRPRDTLVSSHSVDTATRRTWCCRQRYNQRRRHVIYYIRVLIHGSRYIGQDTWIKIYGS